MRLIYSLGLSLIGPMVWAQTPKEVASMSTDRPAYSETAWTLPKHTAQVETGWRYDQLGLNDRVYLPKIWWRAGISNKLEWRAGINLYVPKGIAEIRTEPFELGVKYRAFQKVGKRLHSFSANMVLPSNKNLVNPSTWAIVPRLIGTHYHLMPSISLSYTAGLYAQEALFFGFGTVKIEKTFATNMAIFAEVYAQSNKQYILSLAVAQVCNKHWQWDFSVGLNQEKGKYAAIGLSRRLVKRES